MMRPDFSKSELIPAIAQDAKTGEVLMMAYMNEESYDLTLETGVATYWSRSRSKLWKKGESSGNVQEVHDLYLDCDRDTILLKVTQIGEAACHEGYRSCFSRQIDRTTQEPTIIGEPIFDPKQVYGK